MASHQGEESQMCILSRQLVKPSPLTTANKIIHLNSWDLPFLSRDYMRHGLLLPKPHNLSIELVFSSLLTSFSQALHYFYLFAGRLSTTTHNDDDGGKTAISIHIACNDEGAEFVRASAPNISISSILSDFQVPAFVHWAFPIKGVVNHDGHSLPLLGVQVTELVDGIFVAVSLNHAVADGFSLWHFISTWSKISRGLDDIIPPVLGRWFLDSCPPPIRLPFKDSAEFIKRVLVDPCTRTHCCFHLSLDTVNKLKSKANDEAADGAEISSLQAVSAHTWLSITRARKCGPETLAVHVVAVGYRSKLLKRHPVPPSYVGNALGATAAVTTAGELTGKGLGWAAALLNKRILAYSEAEEEVYKKVEGWSENPNFHYLEDDNNRRRLLTAGSPRFDIYGNDFGWGRPVATRTGWWNIPEGAVKVYRGPEEGSLVLDVNLAKETMSALLQDEEFMETVSLTPH